MPGPIVRSGPSKEYTEKWESVFGKKKTAKKKTAASAAKKKAAKKKK